MTTNKPDMVGFATHHDEPMLFPTRQEAAEYCDDEEEPIALIRLTDYAALQAEYDKLRPRVRLIAGLLESCRVLIDPPERNCSCHISPPCGDCVDHGFERDLIERIDAAIQEVSHDNQ